MAHVGARGEVAIAHKNNPLGTIKLTLMSTSPQIVLLHRLAREKKLFSIWVKSNNEPGETIGGTQAIVKSCRLPLTARSWRIANLKFKCWIIRIG